MHLGWFRGVQLILSLWYTSSSGFRRLRVVTWHLSDHCDCDSPLTLWTVIILQTPVFYQRPGSLRVLHCIFVVCNTALFWTISQTYFIESAVYICTVCTKWSY